MLSILRLLTATVTAVVGLLMAFLTFEGPFGCLLIAVGVLQLVLEYPRD